MSTVAGAARRAAAVSGAFRMLTAETGSSARATRACVLPSAARMGSRMVPSAPPIAVAACARAAPWVVRATGRAIAAQACVALTAAALWPPAAMGCTTKTNRAWIVAGAVPARAPRGSRATGPQIAKAAFAAPQAAPRASRSVARRRRALMASPMGANLPSIAATSSAVPAVWGRRALRTSNVRRFAVWADAVSRSWCVGTACSTAMKETSTAVARNSGVLAAPTGGRAISEPTV
jgi:hypothetical protein